MSTFDQTPYLTRALNWASIDALANTPDYVLAEKLEGCPYLDDMFRAYTEATRAAHDRQVAERAAVQALRDAAAEVERIDPEWDSALCIDRVYHPVPDWLRARADSLAPRPDAPAPGEYSTPDLRTCPFSRAMDRGIGADVLALPDRPLRLAVRGGRLAVEAVRDE